MKTAIIPAAKSSRLALSAFLPIVAPYIKSREIIAALTTLEEAPVIITNEPTKIRENKNMYFFPTDFAIIIEIKTTIIVTLKPERAII